MLLLSMSLSALLSVYAQEDFREREFVEEGKPQLADPQLKVEEVASGLNTPTTMAFLGPNDILVLEKDKGTVQRIVGGKILDQPLLDVNVANSVERCMCGIAIAKHDSKTYVFLYYTEIDGKDGTIDKERSL
jgi:glucose/arabinose dehydrogenase